MDSNVAALLTFSNIDLAIIHRRCTKFIQAPDVLWNIPFKAICTVIESVAYRSNTQ